ncbi:MAG: tetratricopeptide repeat protein [Phycisphaerales bacterium]
MKKLRKTLFFVIVFFLISQNLNAAAPKVIKTIPANGDQNVSPALAQITIEFDQDMNTDGMSICGGGPNFPETTGKTQWLNKRTLVMGIKLKPNYIYELSVNCPSYQSCKGINGEAAEIYPLSFKTGSGTARQKSNGNLQASAVLLQQGIYAEETEGNLDKAVEIYTQIRTDYNDVERIAARATYQMGTCFLKKNDNENAAKYFQEVVDYFPDQKSVAEKAQQQLDKLGFKKENEKNIFDILGTEASTYIGSKYGEISAEAGVKKLYSNSHVYVVDENLTLRLGGFGYVYNWTGKSITKHFRISSTTTINQKFYDIMGNPMDIEMLAEEDRKGHYDIFWNPKEPLSPGAFFNFGWACDGSKPLPNTNQLKMINHQGEVMYETFFLAVPKGMQIVEKSEAWTNKGSVDDWDIYWWKKEVQADTDHIVNVVLAEAEAISQRPVVIKTSPQNFANNVSPDSKEITVTFDKEMYRYGFAWVQKGQPFPQRTGDIHFSDDGFMCSMPVKLEPGKYYVIGINTPPYMSFKSNAEMQPAQEFAFVFATTDENGNPTEIPQKIIAESEKINSTKNKIPKREISNYKIEPNGVMFFKFYEKYTNDSIKPETSKSFKTCLNITKIYEKSGNLIKFTSKKENNEYLYNVIFNKPLQPGESVEGFAEGTLPDQITPVKLIENAYQCYMKYWPQGEPTLTTCTYLLPKDAELISVIPRNALLKDKNGRTEINVEELIPMDGSLIVSFQYKVKSIKKLSVEEQIEAENIVSQGWKLWNEKKFADAEEIFKKALELDPQSDAAYNGLGWAQLNQEKKLNAKASFEKCIALEPKNGAALNGLGSLAYNSNEFDDAIKWWQKVVELSDHKNAASLNLLAKAYNAKGDYQNAIKFYETSLEAEPDNQEIKTDLQKIKDKAAAEYNARLNNLITVNAAKSPDGDRLTVQYAIIEICKAADVPYQWKKSQSLAGSKARKYIEPVNLENISANEAIGSILKPIGLNYAIDTYGVYLSANENEKLQR